MIRLRDYATRLTLIVGVLLWNSTLADAPIFPESAAEIEKALSVHEHGQPVSTVRGLPAWRSDPSRGLDSIVVEPNGDSPVSRSQSHSKSYPDLIRTQATTAALVHFDSDSARIRETSQRLLNEYVKALNGKTLLNTVLVIAGHTDSRSSETYNLVLSQRRAQAVKEYLVRRGIAPQRLIVKGFGEAHPIASNATDTGRALNRRSEFIRVD